MYRRKRKHLILIALSILPVLIIAIGYMAFTALGKELNTDRLNKVIVSDNLAKIPDAKTRIKAASVNNPEDIDNGRVYIPQEEDRKEEIPMEYGSASDRANLEKLIDRIIEISDKKEDS